MATTDNAELRIWTWPDLCAKVEQDRAEKRARRTWGRWRLDTDTLELIYRNDRGRDIYPIDLERMGTSAAMLDWIFQLHKKNWTSAEDLGDLIAALQDIFDPQGWLCSFGCTGAPGKKIDATAHLRGLYGRGPSVGKAAE